MWWSRELDFKCRAGRPCSPVHIEVHIPWRCTVYFVRSLIWAQITPRCLPGSICSQCCQKCKENISEITFLACLGGQWQDLTAHVIRGGVPEGRAVWGGSSVLFKGAERRGRSAGVSSVWDAPTGLPGSGCCRVWVGGCPQGACGRPVGEPSLSRPLHVVLCWRIQSLRGRLLLSPLGHMGFQRDIRTEALDEKALGPNETF